MKSSILKLNKYLKKIPTGKYSTNGKIFIDSKLEIGKELVLVDNKKQPISTRKSDADNSHLDWQRMYTHSEKSTSPLSDYHSTGVSSSAHYNDTPSTSLVEYSMPEKNFIQGIFQLSFFLLVSFFLSFPLCLNTLTEIELHIILLTIVSIEFKAKRISFYRFVQTE